MFDFNDGFVTYPKTGKRVHVAKVLLDMRDESGVSNETRDVLKGAIEYIKKLERTVQRHEGVRPFVREVAIDVHANDAVSLREATAALMAKSRKLLANRGA